MIYEIINPSDKVTLESDNELAAAVSVLLISRGTYGLENEAGKNALPMFLFGGFDEWCKENNITSVDNYITENHDAMITALESVLYGGFNDRACFNIAVKDLPPETVKERRIAWNEERRSSMTNIGKACLGYAEKLRKLYSKELEAEKW